MNSVTHEQQTIADPALESPIVLTPDEIAAVAAGAVTGLGRILGGVEGTTTGFAPPTTISVAGLI